MGDTKAILGPEQRRRMRVAANAHRHRSDERWLLSGMLWSALDALEQAELDRDEAIQSRAHTQQWYAERIQRLRQMAEERGFLTEYCCIVANGVGDIHEPPTYAQMLNLERFARERAEKERDEARRRVEELEERIEDWRYEAMERE